MWELFGRCTPQGHFIAWGERELGEGQQALGSCLELWAEKPAKMNALCGAVQDAASRWRA